MLLYCEMYSMNFYKAHMHIKLQTLKSLTYNLDNFLNYKNTNLIRLDL